jgi:hypothetical protein
MKLSEIKMLAESSNLEDRLANDIKLNWMDKSEEELVTLLKDANDNWMKYLKGLSAEELEGLVSQAYYTAHND